MKKIMFNDRYGLTMAVLEGRKTMTRRIIRAPRKFKGVEDVMLEFHSRLGICFDCVVCDADDHELGQLPLPYEVGDVVAVAQSYRAVWDVYQKRWESLHSPSDWHTPDAILGDDVQSTAGWSNKMFVKADLMPSTVGITGLWFERMQDITDEDCLREGIMEGEFLNTWDRFYYDCWGSVPNHVTFRTPREAFASLIDRISGRGTWDSNPWNVVYTMELTSI